MMVKVWTKEGEKVIYREIERTYDFKKTDGFNHLVAKDKVLEVFPDEPMSRITFNTRRNPRIELAVPTHLKSKIRHPYE